jgi:hypothetical protein
MSHDRPIACSLSAGEQSRRLAEIRAVARAGPPAIESGGAMRFDPDPATREWLEAVVAAESECCPFLEFELREDAGGLLLSIAGPDEAKPLVRELIDAPAGRP